MALSATSVEKAKEILTKMMDKKKIATEVYNEKNNFKTGKIILAGKVGDGYENVYINVPEIEKDHLDYFYERKKEVPNSHFIIFKHYKKQGVVQIGWF
jgi:hypothetical protein